MKWRFAAIFLVTFAALLPLWWLGDVGDHYQRLVVRAASWFSPIVNGWLLEPLTTGPVAAAFRRGGQRMDLLLQLPALSMGLMPLLSLIAATPNQSRRDLASAVALGVGLYVAVDVGIVLLYPIILDRPNVFKDTLGVFSGLVGFVVAPLGIWFCVTYRALSPLWQIAAQRLQEADDGRRRRAIR